MATRGGVPEVVAEPAGGSVEIDALGFSEIAAAAGVLARGMRDNPNHAAIFGPDPHKRVRALKRGFAAYLRVATAQAPLCARLDGVVVGVAGVLGPGRCRLPAIQQLRLLPSMAGLTIGDMRRASRVTHAWAARDPKRAHSHLGPMAVDEGLKGRGIGTRLLETYCGQLDVAHLGAYLETETARNVRFYERFGFETVGRAEVLGNRTGSCGAPHAEEAPAMQTVPMTMHIPARGLRPRPLPSRHRRRPQPTQSALHGSLFGGARPCAGTREVSHADEHHRA